MLFVVVAVIGCDKQQDEYFSESSAKRADAVVEANKQVLTSVPVWKLEYFPGAGMSFGGYNVYFSFGTDGKVTVQSEIANATQKAESLYSVAQSGGSVLSFDTYNEIFSFFSEPASGVGNQGTGMGGDNDFLILKASTDSIILRSLKHGYHYKMIPFSGSVSDEITAIQDAEEIMDFPSYKMTVSGIEVGVSKSYRTLTFTYIDGEDEKSVTAPYIQTVSGYSFYESVSVLGVDISELKYDPSTYTFSSGDEVSVEGFVPPLSNLIMSGNFYMSGSSSSMSSALLPYFKKAYEASSNENENLVFMGFGTDINSANWGLYFKSGNYYGLLPFKVNVVADDEVTFTFNATAGSGTTWLGNGIFYYNIGYYYPVYALTGSTDGSKSKTWKLTTDNVKSPTWIKFVNVSNENEYFTVTVDMVTNPFV